MTPELIDQGASCCRQMTYVMACSRQYRDRMSSVLAQLCHQPALSGQAELLLACYGPHSLLHPCFMPTLPSHTPISLISHTPSPPLASKALYPRPQAHAGVLCTMLVLPVLFQPSSSSEVRTSSRKPLEARGRVQTSPLQQSRAVSQFFPASRWQPSMCFHVFKTPAFPMVFLTLPTQFKDSEESERNIKCSFS